MHIIVKDTIVLFLDVGEEWEPRVVILSTVDHLHVCNWDIISIIYFAAAGTSIGTISEQTKQSEYHYQI
jgi:hypothetical protein